MAKKDVTSQEPDNGKEWASDLVKRIGVYAKTLRGTKSAQWLSDETAALGMRISPSVIARLDSGHRGDVLSVPELLVLSRALGIPPLALLNAGANWEEEVTILPGRAVPTLAALDWIRGAEVDPRIDLWSYNNNDSKSVEQAAMLISSLVHLANVEERLGNALDQWEGLNHDSDDPSRQNERHLLMELIEELRKSQAMWRRLIADERGQ